MKSLLLTFDVEEFDLPREYGLDIDEEKKYEISREGVKSILEILKKHKLVATFFVTADFAEKNKELIKKLAFEGNEIGCHGYKHGHNYRTMDETLTEKYLKDAKKILEEISGKSVIGFRAPRFEYPNYALLKRCGFEYESSLNPTFFPMAYYFFRKIKGSKMTGSYDRLFEKRKVHENSGIKIIPLSVMPFLRLPLFWAFFRTFGVSYAKMITRLVNQDYAHLVFHVWEFSDIRKIKLPFYIRCKTGDKLKRMLDRYIEWCLKKGFKTKSVKEFLFGASAKVS